MSLLKLVALKKRLSSETNSKDFFSLSNTDIPNAKDQNRLTISWLVAFGFNHIVSFESIKISLAGSLIFTLSAACNVLPDSLLILIWSILYFYHLKRFVSFSKDLLQSQNVWKLKTVRPSSKHSLILSLLVICILVDLFIRSVSHSLA